MSRKSPRQAAAQQRLRERLFAGVERIARDYRVNRRIRAPIVRVIRGEDSSSSTVMPIQDAIRLADEEGLDLVEVAPNQSPPVCRLLDYGRFKFIQAKKAKEARKASRGTNQQREVRMRPRISDNDIQSKIRTVKGLLAEGAKVRVAVLLRGRENTHPRGRYESPAAGRRRRRVRGQARACANQRGALHSHHAGAGRQSRPSAGGGRSGIGKNRK